MADKQGRKNWIDLSAHEAQLIIAQHRQTNQRILVLIGSDIDQQAKALGFQRDEATGFYTRDLPQKLDIQAFREQFPRMNMRPMDPAQFMAWYGPRPEAGNTNAASGSRSTTRSGSGRTQQASGSTREERTDLGLNRFGSRVYETSEGRRHYVDAGGARIDDDGSKDPDLFLRAPDEAALSRCANALVQMAAQGTYLRSAQIRNFKKVVGAWSDDRIRAAIEGALARRVATAEGATMADIYSQAVRVHEGIVETGRGELDAVSTPAPVAVALQRLAGTSAELDGQRVAVAHAGSGTLLTHISNRADLRIFVDSENDLPHVRATAQSVAIPSERIRTGDPDYSDTDVAIAAPKRALLDQPVELEDGVQIGRQDYLELAQSLEKRAEDGRTIFLIEGPRDDAEAREAENFRGWIGRYYAIEGTADIDPGLCGRRPGDAPMRAIVVGSRRPEPKVETPEPAMRRREVAQFNDLWTWSTQVIQNRAKIADWKAAELGQQPVQRAGGDQEEQGENLRQNEYQAPYVAASSVAPSSTMVPRNLEGATRQALARAARAYDGDVDAFVGNRLGMTRGDLGECFSPEQIDALALDFAAADRGRGFLVADDTGLGKGRVMAAIAKRAVNEGKKVLYLTERAPNLSDVWRDVRHIGAQDDFSVMILNDNAPIIDENTGEVVLEAPEKAEVNRVMRSEAWPEDYNFIMGTYSQFSGKLTSDRKRQRLIDQGEGDPDARNIKSRWVVEAPDENVVIICDESHNATSQYSNTAKNVTRAIGKAGETHYASATWAKNIKTLLPYKPLFPDDMNLDHLNDILKKGGETLQEVLSTMLVSDGVMVRREHDLSQAEFVSDMDTDERLERNRAYMDRLAPILAQMAYMSGEMDRMVNYTNRRAEAQVDNMYGDPENLRENQRDNRQQTLKRLQLTRVNFGSPLYRISQLFKTALNVDRTIELARQSLQDGEKPIVLVENTMQQILQDLKEEQEREGYATSRPPEFRDLMYRLLDQLRYARRGDGEETYDLAENSPQLQQQIEEIRGMIDDLPSIPLSPIDSVMHALERDGWTVEEVTGRSLKWDGERVVPRQAESRIQTVTNFNNDTTNALVVNTAGCTGISLHAGARFINRNRRHLIELQAPGDIVKQMQAYGRVNRFDQVVPPRITTPSSGLPIEVRLQAMRNQKLRRMSANVIADRNSAALVDNIPDLMNSVGDKVVTRYAQGHPNLMRRLGLGNLVQEEGEDFDQQAQEVGEDTMDNRRFANMFLARLIMLPTDEQERILEEVDAEFTAHIEELDAMGRNPLRSSELDGEVHVIEEETFEGADTENPNTVFSEPVTLRKIDRRKEVAPMRGRDVTTEVARGEERIAADRPDTYANRLRRRYFEILGYALPEGVNTADEAEEAGIPAAARKMRRMDRLIECLDHLKPGSEIVYTDWDGDPQNAIVTDLKMPKVEHEHLPAHYEVWYVAPGTTRPKAVRLPTLMQDEEFAILPGLHGDDWEGVIQRFERAPEGQVSERRAILSGNLFRATELALDHKLGNVVAYRDDEGIRHRGIMVSKRAEALYALPVRLDSPHMAAEAARTNCRVTSDKNAGSGGVTVFAPAARQRPETLRVTLPERQTNKWRFIYEDPGVQALFQRMENPGARKPKFDVHQNEIDDILQTFWDAGCRFYISGNNRDWANAWRARQYGEEARDDNRNVAEVEAGVAEDVAPEAIDEDEADVFAQVG